MGQWVRGSVVVVCVCGGVCVVVVVCVWWWCGCGCGWRADHTGPQGVPGPQGVGAIGRASEMPGRVRLWESKVAARTTWHPQRPPPPPGVAAQGHGGTEPASPPRPPLGLAARQPAWVVVLTLSQRCAAGPCPCSWPSTAGPTHTAARPRSGATCSASGAAHMPLAARLPCRRRAP